MHSTQPRVVGQADENPQLMFSISTKITGFHLFQCFRHQNWKQLQSVSRAGRDGDVYDAVCLTGKYFQVKERSSHLSWARYLPSPRQLGFANQIIFNQTPTPFLVAPSHAAWGFAALGKAGFDIPASPIPLLLEPRLPMGVSWHPHLVDESSPFSLVSGWEWAGVQPPQGQVCAALG